MTLREIVKTNPLPVVVACKDSKNPPFTIVSATEHHMMVKYDNATNLVQVVFVDYLADYYVVPPEEGFKPKEVGV